jgi:hypothetical protein
VLLTCQSARLTLLCLPAKNIYSETRNSQEQKELAARLLIGEEIVFVPKHFHLLLTLALIAAASGCGSGPPLVVPPPSGGFSASSLKGQYAFSLSGIQGQSGGYTASIGSFTADGSGSITTGLADILNLSSGQATSPVSITGGTYTIQANGRGTITLQSANGNLNLSVALQSPSTGYIAETDLAAATSGTIHLQNSGQFSAAALGAAYVFELSGISFVPVSVTPISLIGQFIANGAGTITGGVMDSNSGKPSGATAIAAGSYALDPTNGSTFGRGTMSFSSYTLAFYIIDSTHLVLLEEDKLGGSAGDAFVQSGPVPTQDSQLTGGFVYLINGLFTQSTQGPVVIAARFTANGNGGLTSITLDENNSGNYTHLSQGSNASYSIDPANSGSGRGTFTFINSGTTYSRVFYAISPTQAVVSDTTPNIIGNGPMTAQASGPFTLSGLTGKFVFNWSGVLVGVNSTIPIQEDYVGQYALSSTSSSNIAGATDYTQVALSGNQLFTDVAVGGMLSINGDGTANNLYKFAVAGSPSFTINFQAYFVNPSTVYMVNSDSNRTLAGVLNQQ